MKDLIEGLCRTRDREGEWMDGSVKCLWHPDDAEQLFPIRIMEMVSEDPADPDLEVRTTIYNVSHSKTGGQIVPMPVFDLDRCVEAVEKLLAMTSLDDELHQLWLMDDYKTLLKSLGPKRKKEIREIIAEAA